MLRDVDIQANQQYHSNKIEEIQYQQETDKQNIDLAMKALQDLIYDRIDGIERNVAKVQNQVLKGADIKANQQYFNKIEEIQKRQNDIARITDELYKYLELLRKNKNGKDTWELLDFEMHENQQYYKNMIEEMHMHKDYIAKQKELFDA